jgi:hypothetical protein
VQITLISNGFAASTAEVPVARVARALDGVDVVRGVAG